MITDEREARMADSQDVTALYRQMAQDRAAQFAEENRVAADQRLRLECLKLAVTLVGRGNPIGEAERLAAYVRTGVAGDETMRSPGANSLLDAVVEAETAFRRDRNRPQQSPDPEAE